MKATDVRGTGASGPRLTAYAASASSELEVLAFVVCSGSLTWLRRPRLASLISTVKVETDHPLGVGANCTGRELSAAFGLYLSVLCSLCSQGRMATAFGLYLSALCSLCSQGRMATAFGLYLSALCSLCSQGRMATAFGLYLSALCSLCSQGRMATAFGL